MKKRTLATAILASSVGALSWAGGVPEIAFKKSVEEFQFQEPGETADEQIGKILDLATDFAVLQLDWRLRFSGGLDGYGCENGRVTDYTIPHDLPMHLASTHFVMSVIPGSPLSFPFNSVSCMMLGGEDFVIRIVGYYTMSLVDIPTANDIELRPISPFALVPTWQP